MREVEATVHWEVLVRCWKGRDVDCVRGFCWWDGLCVTQSSKVGSIEGKL